MLKGYFSAITEGKETTVIYVWDVSIRRATASTAFRVSKTPAKGEGWAAVSAPTMQGDRRPDNRPVGRHGCRHGRVSVCLGSHPDATSIVFDDATGDSPHLRLQ